MAAVEGAVDDDDDVVVVAVAVEGTEEEPRVWFPPAVMAVVLVVWKLEEVRFLVGAASVVMNRWNRDIEAAEHWICSVSDRFR